MLWWRARNKLIDQVRSTGDRDRGWPQGSGGVCVDGLAMLSVDDETMSVTEKDEVQIRSCSIGLSNESGELVAPTELIEITQASHSPYPPSGMLTVGGMTYTQVVFEATRANQGIDGGIDTELLGMYSNCSFQLGAMAFAPCPPEASFCVPEPVATLSPFNRIFEAYPERIRLIDSEPRAVGAAGAAQANKAKTNPIQVSMGEQCEPEKRVAGCLKEAIGIFEENLAPPIIHTVGNYDPEEGWTTQETLSPGSFIPTSRPLSGRMCYDNLQISNDVALFHEIDDPIKKRGCEVVLRTSTGVPIPLNEVIDIIGTGLRAPLPLGFPPNLALSENYAQVRVRIRKYDEQELWAYVFSDCDADWEPDCTAFPAAFAVPPFPEVVDPIEQCEEAAEDEAERWLREEWESQLGTSTTMLQESHFPSCLSGNGYKEAFWYEASDAEHHFVLKYFDQSSNLIMTVAPAGVAPGAATVDGADVETVTEPEHRMQSRFSFDSLNNLLWQKKPDSGIKRLWYDDAGRLRYTQEARQVEEEEFGYMKYDNLGRVIEVGVIKGVTIDQLLEKRNETAFPAIEPNSGFSLAEVTRRHYDKPVGTCSSLDARYLRGRVAAVIADNGINAEGDERHVPTGLS